MKKWYQSKMIYLGLLEAAAGIGTFFADLPTGASIGFIVAGVATVLIRVITDTAIE